MISNLENWTEVTKGLYRYVIAACCCYEIHIMHHVKDTDILSSNASLYVVDDLLKHKIVQEVGDYYSERNESKED